MTETELLFTELLGCERVDLYLDRKRTLDKEQSGRIADALRRRRAGEPLPYILGKAWFMGLELKVGPSVLIPRQETEVLVESCLRYARERASALEVLDVGTGSGCVAIALVKLAPGTRVTAVDISREALQLAQSNARQNGVDVQFVCADLFSGLGERKFDMIVSNPPYVRSGDIDKLEPEVRAEPRLALDGGRDGLDIYRRIISSAAGLLTKGGLLLLETGFDQAGCVRDLLESSGDFIVRETVRDLAGIERVVASSRAI